MSELALLASARSRHVSLDRAMIAAVVVTGVIAAVQVGGFFWLATPIVAIGLLRASRRAAPPAFEPIENDPNQLPMRVEVAVHDAVAKLPSGDARRLLGDVVRQARPLFGTTRSHFDANHEDQARREAADLVLAACDTALELSRLDALLASDERARRSTRDRELLGRLTSARALFASRLSAAAHALGAMYASGIEHGTPASDLVAELTAELSADAAARTQARAELDELLGAKRRD